MKNTPKVNEVLDDDALLKRYRKEILDLKKQLEEVCNKLKKSILSTDSYLETSCFKPKAVKFGGVGELFKVISATFIERRKIEYLMNSLEQLMVVNISVCKLRLNEIN